jgi:putative copper resistance protein D
MAAESLLAALVRGLGLVGVAAVIGGLVLDQLILPAGAPELAGARRRLRRWVTGCLVALTLTTVAELLVRTQVMSRAPLAVAVAALPDVVTRTHFGAIWIVRGLALTLAVVLSLARAAALRVLCLLVALGVALTTTLTGHAAEWGDLTVSIGVDFAHAVAASAWTGGLIGLSLVVLRGDPPYSPPLLGALARRFSRLAGGCVLTVALTGTSNAWAQLGALPTMWTSPYGRVLGVKLLVVATLVWLGAVNRYVIVPRLGSPRASSGFGARVFRVTRLAILGRRGVARSVAPSRFSTYLAAEALIALAVFASTAALGEATPGRHARQERRPASHVTAKELRQSGSGARGGSLTVPPGDAARGRMVFVKLQCFGCHAVQGEPLPGARRPGPDLTGIGSRHPADLVESIMNPNAMILDGPGYTDARGSSTMPDYRETLTVGELIDLVAYLKSLPGVDRAPRGGLPLEPTATTIPARRAS